MSARNNKSREQLSAYLDGELSEADAAAVARALQADPQLAGDLSRLRAVRQLVASLPRESAPAGLASRVLGQARPAGRVPWTARLARLAAAAVVLVAVGLGITMVCYLSKAPRGDQDELALTDAPEPPAVAAAAVLAAADAEDMPVVQFNASNRVVAEQELEEMFSRNGIQLVAKARAKVAPAGAAETANFYDRTQTGMNQTRYTVVMDTKRLRQIISELNSLRASNDIAVIRMSRQLEPARGRHLKSKDKAEADPWRYKAYRAARTVPDGKPVPAHLPRSREPEMAADRVGLKVALADAATSGPAARKSTSAPAAPTAAPLDYRQFVQDARLRGDRLATVDFNELVIIVNGDDGPVAPPAAGE
jgi:anti-sigma factor RsiW